MLLDKPCKYLRCSRIYLGKLFALDERNRYMISGAAIKLSQHFLISNRGCKVNKSLVRLKPSVVVEPLVARWHAWPYLISPATSCAYAAFRHVSLMESFLAAPDVHATACKNPSLRGGPFVDLPAESVPAVRELLEQTRTVQKAQIEFANEFRHAYRMLLEKADGYSIESHYQSMPESLRGYVELTYATSGGPEMRLIEPLLYKHPVFDESLQTAMMYLSDGEDRSFAFSTPRLSRPDAFEINSKFSSHVYDFLSQLRFEGRSRSDVYETLGVHDAAQSLVDSMLIEVDGTHLDQTSAVPEYARWRYFGHACVLVQTSQGHSVLVDPIIAYQDGSAPERFTFSDLPGHIDFVLLTHNHADHVLLETLLALRTRIGTIIVPKGSGSLADPSLRMMFESIGFASVVEFDPLQSVEVGDLRITAVPFLGEHGDLDIRTKSGWLIDASGKRLLMAADSNNLEPKLYDLIREWFGQIHILFLGMECLGAPVSWTYGPVMPLTLDRKKDQTRRLNGSDCERGMKVVNSLGCNEVYVYAMGAEPWLQFITSIDPAETTVPAVNARELVEKCRALGIKSERLYGRAESRI